MHHHMRPVARISAVVAGMVIFNMGESLLDSWHNPRNPNEATKFADNFQKAREATLEQPKKAAAGHH